MALSKGQMTRQKMINLMYLVFIAMLALNISTEVLDGFVLMNDNLQESIKIADERNEKLYSDINVSYTSNPEKTRDSYELSKKVKLQSDSVVLFIQKLKEDIARKTDGSDADADNLKKKDKLGPSSEVMMAPVGGQGKRLKEMLDAYRENMLVYISDSIKQNVVRRTLSTEPSERARKDRKNWLQASFENMPSIAAVTLLTELEMNVRQAEGEVLNNLVQDIDVKDLRVNELSAFVVPQSNIVMQGLPYRANVILAAVDTTQRPKVVIDGKELPLDNNGLYEVGTASVGTKSFNGYIELLDRMGNSLRRDFTQEYTVIEPMATIAPLLMDVVYAGIPNEISISVPGIPSQDIVATAVKGGTLTKSGKNWVAAPATAQVGQKFVISVSARVNGALRTIVAGKEFRIRRLPDPTPYIAYNDAEGKAKMFKRGNLSRSVLLGTDELKAAIDDGILNIPFTVTSFTTLSLDAMNNASPELSNGAKFSDRQKEQIKRLARGSELFITKIKVKGPDGERELNTMVVRIN
ncbi:gliding motility protein GldM [Dysgonomonas sp. Marseille-P4361]|uniref:type IX secretion system motor protein PorM/GldM n=1 Tax=Dysgonomonas sp. Marseille-P4361 TaxID=2161820 RepID=UPI000D555AB1|nr:gliding motility protein GldM [Dysgonomonas sp. Marseille-P4361]